MCQRENKQHIRHIKNPAGDNRGDQQRSRRDGRNLVAAQNVCFAFLHGAYARAHQPIAEDTDDEDHRYHDCHGSAALAVHRLPENKEEG